MSKLFGTDGIRGIANVELTTSLALKVGKSCAKVLKNEDKKLVNNKSLEAPFTVLALGVDSDRNGLNANAAFNGDTLILMTFNPKTLTATMFSIPRDTYVPIACRNNAYAKINSSAAYGTSCVIDTIEQLKGQLSADVSSVLKIGGIN